MHDRRWITIALGLAVVIAAAIGWRGSRPTSPIATTHSDGVTVVPATGTLPREEARPAATAPATPPPPPADPPPAAPSHDAVSMFRDLDQVAADFDRQPRDPAWSPGREASLRNAFAGIPGLDTAVAADCRASLCRVTARTAANLPRDEADRAVATLQARTSAQTRGSGGFTANHFNLEQNEESGEAKFTAYLLRR